MNSENSKTSEAHVLMLRLTDKLDFGRGEKSIDLSKLSIYHTWNKLYNKNKSYNKNKF